MFTESLHQVNSKARELWGSWHDETMPPSYPHNPHPRKARRSQQRKQQRGTSLQGEPLFLKLTGSIAGTANARATRALLSVIIKRWIVGAGSARLTTTEAPTVQPIQALYRYKTPRGVSPYFNLVHPLRLLYNVRSVKYEEPTGDLTKCVILVAPMPLMGYRNNNNTAASSALTVELELWQIKKGAGGFYARTNRWNQDGTRTDILVHIDGTTEDITAPNLGYYYVFYQICAETFFMWDGDHGISVTSDPDTGAFTWVLLDGKLNPTPLIVFSPS